MDQTGHNHGIRAHEGHAIKEMAHQKSLDADGGRVNNFDRLSYLDLLIQLLKNKSATGSNPATQAQSDNPRGRLMESVINGT